MPQVRQIRTETVYDEPQVVERHITGVAVVNYILGIAEVLLSLRFIFRLFGASPDATFTNVVYAITDPLMAPFASIARGTLRDGAVLDWSILVAMAIYALIAWAVVRLIEISSQPQEA